MAVPGGSTKTLNDLKAEVIDALQQRTDVAPLVPRYLKRAIQELTVSTPFEELRRTGPQTTLTVGAAVYPVTQFVASGDDYSFPEAFTIFVDPPTNSVEMGLKYKTPAAIEMMMGSATMGMPAFWSRYGSNFHFGPNPDKTYTVFLRYQVKHPFPEEEAALGGQQLFMPADWEEIVIYSAAERIAFVKRWNDQRKELHDMLFGDPEFQVSAGKRGRPGLVAARLLQVERDQQFNTRQLGIVHPRYTR